MRIKKNLSEHQIQSQIVQYLKVNHILYFAVPNGVMLGGTRISKARYILYLIKEGFRPGAIDLVIVLDIKNTPSTLYVEVKTDKNKLTEKQKEFKEELLTRGHTHMIWRSLDHAIEYLKGVKKCRKLDKCGKHLNY